MKGSNIMMNKKSLFSLAMSGSVLFSSCNAGFCASANLTGKDQSHTQKAEMPATDALIDSGGLYCFDSWMDTDGEHVIGSFKEDESEKFEKFKEELRRKGFETVDSTSRDNLGNIIPSVRVYKDGKNILKKHYKKGTGAEAVYDLL
jgi:hypothetical protein